MVRAWPSHLRYGLGLVAGLVLLWLGGAAINAPIRLGGPMHLGFEPMAGLVELLAGTAVIALLPPPWSRPAWALAIPVLLATVGRNFIVDPPLDDGAWRQLRLGGGGGEDTWPAGPAWTVFGACPLALALNGAASQVRSSFVRNAAAAALFCAAGSLAYEPFVRELTAMGQPWPLGWMLPASCGVAGVIAMWRGRAWSLVGACLLALSCLCLATWAIYASVAS